MDLFHLACASGIPVVGLYGPTDPKIAGPYGERCKVVRKDLPCSPCTVKQMKTCKHADCMNSISKEDIITSLKELLDDQGQICKSMQ